jgi:hypothetical protein
VTAVEFELLIERLVDADAAIAARDRSDLTLAAVRRELDVIRSE